MEYPTLPQRLLESVDTFKCPRAQMFKSGTEWQSIAAPEMLRRVAGLSAQLEKLGVREGDRVAIFTPNCPEWHVADFAITGLGAAGVPIYFREAEERIEYILRHSGSKAAFVSGGDQTAALLRIRERLPTLEQIICAGKAAGDLPAGVLCYETLIARAGEAEILAYRRRVDGLNSGQLASIIYTSGTTGEPKGVMLSHANFVSNGMASFERFGLVPTDLGLSFLPLSHVYERIADYGYLCQGIPLAYVARMEEVTQALLEVRPTVTAAVPRFCETFYATLMERGGQATGLRRRLFDWAINVARQSVPWRAYGKPPSLSLKIQWGIANRIVYSKFQAGVGGRVRIFISGGAPLSKALAEFLTAVGFVIMQGYGLTETSPVIATNVPGANHIGTVGPPIPGLELRIAEDGEIQVRGPCVMMGYYLKPEETRAVLSEDGWLSTGDIGHLEEGFLVITDRKKELLKTAGGKLVAPAPIENLLKTSPYILNAVLLGDKRRFIAALIVPNFANVQALAEKTGVTLGSPKDMAANAWVHKLIEGEVTRLCSHMAQYQTIKRFALLDHDLSFDNGELTYTLKLKRRVIEEHYAGIIQNLYAEPATARL